MKFQPGQSGNPAGRPVGSRNKRAIASERLFTETGDELTRIAIDLARTGHQVALKLCMDRVCPIKDRPVTFDLPTMATAADGSAPWVASCSASRTAISRRRRP